SNRHQDVELTSGDLFVFGGVSRMACHSVVKIYPGTAPHELGMRQGRLSITIRQTGLTSKGTRNPSALKP
ncbi:MAG: alpha-ketoglutarate-dependent dioxygenase AlkB, partial [Chroococcidiopsidaceae cyanobacterium CP_BM_RX_35]|nr:alpha-ketoglutarate-dependent dioxygenase AlkB [Chroococcidiopsidaceae cyanobacterium CP_BM_RX_35]